MAAPQTGYQGVLPLAGLLEPVDDEGHGRVARWHLVRVAERQGVVGVDSARQVLVHVETATLEEPVGARVGGGQQVQAVVLRSLPDRDARRGGTRG